MSNVFFFTDTATTEIYTLSLHDALPILCLAAIPPEPPDLVSNDLLHPGAHARRLPQLLHVRSEEHTSELQSHSDLVCRLLLEKKIHAARVREGWEQCNADAVTNATWHNR